MTVIGRGGKKRTDAIATGSTFADACRWIDEHIANMDDDECAELIAEIESVMGTATDERKET